GCRRSGTRTRRRARPHGTWLPCGMPICSGSIVQTAWVTDDLAQTESYLSDHFGAGHWTRFEGIVFGPDTCEYRGRPAEFAADISLTYLGEMQLELIQPLTGESIYHDF